MISGEHHVTGGIREDFPLIDLITLRVQVYGTFRETFLFYSQIRNILPLNSICSTSNRWLIRPVSRSQPTSRVDVPKGLERCSNTVTKSHFVTNR